ncbi:MAG: hypothetical protein BGO51_09455 [Rhodospirillales bacterium 69-11]|nr:ribonuclease E/G [Rhodospirillales bacterium]OJW26110.1 MAG: hypothetical protein BGO51_09455 [Rhodospirillales bacterium 69-11]
MSLCLRVACSPGERRVAVLRDDTLLDYAIDRPGAPDGVGDLHRGRIAAVLPAMAGAFVSLDGDAQGFLPDSEGARGRTQGEAIGVRITRAAQGGKGPRLTARLDAADDALVGSGPPALLRRGPDALARLAARYPGAGILVDDPAYLAALRHPPLPATGESVAAPVAPAAFLDRCRLVPRAFDSALEAELEALGEPDLVLPSGARLSIHPTPALVAIDVDAGAAVGGRAGKTAQHVALNRDVLPVLAAQIRLRNLSGAILVDLAGLPAKRRAGFGAALAEALAADPLHPRLLGFTALGLAEIVRPRVHPPLHEMLAGPHAAGLAALRRIASDLNADPRRLPVLRAAPAVMAALQQDPVALPDLARRAGRALMLRSDPSLPATAWTLEAEHG